MSRWRDEFDTLVSSPEPHAKIAKNAKIPESGVPGGVFGNIGNFGMAVPNQTPKSADERGLNFPATTCPVQSDRLRTINLRADPDPDEPDSSDPEVGQRIIEEIRAGGAWITYLVENRVYASAQPWETIIEPTSGP